MSVDGLLETLFICLICTVIVRCVILLALQAIAIMIDEVRARHDDKVS